MGNGGVAPCILNLGTRWKWVVSFILWPLYPMSNLDMVAKKNHCPCWELNLSCQSCRCSPLA